MSMLLTVSYTHLDVYKRQDLGNAGQPPVIKGAADILELFERIKKENEKTADGEQGTYDITAVSYTHLSTPIIYRDLKPEHIIVCHNKLKLIDFGVSAYVIQAGNNFNHYGNIEFLSLIHISVSGK